MTVTNLRSYTGHALLPASDVKAREAAKPLLFHGDVSSWTFGQGTVVWTIWPAVLLHTTFAAVVTSVSLTTEFHLAVPPVLITVLGVVIGFVIAYRVSSGYDRYWAGRCCWSDIVKISRTMGRLIWIHVPLHGANDGPSDYQLQAEKIMREKRLALDLVEGFSVALKHHLRGEAGIYYEDLYHLVKPLYKHSRPQRDRGSRNMMRHKCKDGRCSSVSAFSSPSSREHEPTSIPDPIIPSINEYGTFGRSFSSLCSSADESEPPLLFPSAPRQPSRPKVRTELVPFASLFSSLFSTTSRQRKDSADIPTHSAEMGVSNCEYESRTEERHPVSSRHKFRPKIAGGGRNVPLEILRCLSDWLAVLDDRGFVPSGPMGGMYGCVASFEDSLSTLERILTTPIPFVYFAHIRQCVWFYLFLLPFQLVGQFRWYTIPGVCIAAFFYIGFLAAGEEIEQPFGYDSNDLDLDLFCREIVHVEIETLKKMRNANVLFPSTDAIANSGQCLQNSIAALAADNKQL